jgi:Asp-tRNA(Asn)/Glu-tRNA(Gln) amidotransferase A subunit family amidase
MPVSIKDLFAAAGYPCFAGSSLRLPADPWERDGPLVAKLRRQLGVIMGKTHMVEFAFGGTGQNSHWGAPYNPWDGNAHRSVGGQPGPRIPTKPLWARRPGGPDWMPITPKTGSLFHADSQTE